jgi:tetratricopeptide (TPR) repeat protein
MRRSIITLSLFLLAIHCVVAQSDNSAEARRLAIEGIHKTDAGDLDAGLELLQKASSLDPGNDDYRYEQAYVYYMKEDNAKVAEIIEKIINGPSAIDRWWELLGNAYDNLGKPEKAVATYEAGLKRFPESGILDLELGVMAAKKNDIDKAVGYWEEGIRSTPAFPSNYYWAAKAFCNSSERIWGMIYGEIFLNLEPNTKRTREISALLYDTYRRSITRHGDTLRVDVGNGAMMMRPPKGGNIRMPFALVYTTDLTLSSVGIYNSPADTVSIASLNAVREKFIENWHRLKHDAEYPNVLFERQAALAAAGHFEAYNYWLLSAGSPDSRIWADAHREKLTAFITWLQDHPMRVDSSNVFSRLLIEKEG